MRFLILARVNKVTPASTGIRKAWMIPTKVGVTGISSPEKLIVTPASTGIRKAYLIPTKVGVTKKFTVTPASAGKKARTVRQIFLIATKVGVTEKFTGKVHCNAGFSRYKKSLNNTD